MQLSINQSILSKYLDNASKFLSNKDTIPILSHIVLHVTEEGLEVVAGNVETFIKSFIPAEEFTLEATGSAAIPGKKLTEIIKKMSGEVTLETNDKEITIKAGKSEIVLSTMDSEEYPPFPEVHGNSLILKGADFRDLINQTAYAVSTQESTPVLMGVLFSQTGDKLKLIACDRHRLAQIEIDNDMEEFQAIVDGKTLTELTKIISDKEEIELTFNNGMIAKTPEFTFYSRILDGSYPDTSKLIPYEFKTQVTLNTVELSNAIDLLYILAKDDGKTALIKITVDPSGLLIESKAQTQRAKESIDVKEFSGEPITFSANSKFLSDALKTIEAAETEIKLTGPMNPIILNGRDEVGLALVLPYRTTS